MVLSHGIASHLIHQSFSKTNVKQFTKGCVLDTVRTTELQWGTDILTRVLFNEELSRLKLPKRWAHDEQLAGSFSLCWNV